LAEEVCGDESEGTFILHQAEALRGTGEEISEVRTAPWGDELCTVLRLRDGWIEDSYYVVAETAVEMDVQFDLGEHGSSSSRN
jgi:hypothetical protein